MTAFWMGAPAVCNIEVSLDFPKNALGAAEALRRIRGRNCGLRENCIVLELVVSGKVCSKKNMYGIDWHEAVDGGCKKGRVGR